MIKEAVAFLRGGTSSFYEPELLILNSVANELPKAKAKVFSQQIRTVSLIQRHNPGRLVAAYYPKNSDVPELPYPGYKYCLAKISYKIDKNTKTTYIVLHNGKFMTFERNVPLKNDSIEIIVKIVLHPKGYKPVAEEIDSEKHDENA